MFSPLHIIVKRMQLYQLLKSQIVFCVEPDTTPDPSGLDHINEFRLPDDDTTPCEDDIPALPTFDSPHASHVILGAGITPVPRKLVNWIQKGEFIEMSELLPERLTSELMSSESPPHKSKRRLVTSILE